MMLRTQTQIKGKTTRPLYAPQTKKTHVRNATSVMGGYSSETERKMGVTFSDFDVKPHLLETKVSKNQEFMQLSDGFKKLFVKDEKDQKLVLPIAGYGGHRRGDKSQNFFGKSFRDSSLQSKKLQRFLHKSNKRQ